MWMGKPRQKRLLVKQSFTNLQSPIRIVERRVRQVMISYLL